MFRKCDEALSSFHLDGDLMEPGHASDSSLLNVIPVATGHDV